METNAHLHFSKSYSGFLMFDKEKLKRRFSVTKWRFVTLKRRFRKMKRRFKKVEYYKE
ncbi:MAG: hypothetical protein LBO06_05325 [Bacteroidales bacterium]|nr:hypothetical protein [Bacteroidales bacterium]